jgi:hypothetical protein
MVSRRTIEDRSNKELSRNDGIFIAGDVEGGGRVDWLRI